jgi:hypothetical protein
VVSSQKVDKIEVRAGKYFPFFVVWQKLAKNKSKYFGRDPCQAFLLKTNQK